MKNHLILLLFCCLTSVGAFAQIQFGLKAGLATESLQGEEFRLDREGRQDLLFAIADADYGFQFGALLRIPLSDRFDIQTELTFNSAKTDFRIDDPDNSVASGIFRERYNDINIPLLASWKLAFLRFQVGPVGHVYVSSISDLMDDQGIERTFDSFNLGYTIGGSIDIGKITLDVRYDGNFSRYGEDIMIDGGSIRIDQAPRRWIGSVAYRFGN
jgi:hypothetical protein